MTDRDKHELAQVFSSVLRPYIDELKQEFVAAAVELLEQQASDFASIMESKNADTIGKMLEQRDRVKREQQRDENRISELMLDGIRGMP